MKIPEPNFPHDPATPRQLGKYELVCRIGIGGMAEVFLARQKGFHKFRKLVVVKAIHPHLSSDQKFINLLLHEARVSALLKHPRVVDIYDLGMEDGIYFLAMEYLAGQPLTEILKNGLTSRKLDPLSATRIFADIADGLHAAHTLKAHTGESIELVHRDVSPANIIVLYDGNAKLVDFGISKAQRQLSDEDISEVKGKLGYSAPEQLRRETVNTRADIFSLGVVMWETLTHKRLFAGASPRAVLDKMITHKPPPPSMMRDGVSRAIDKICLRALMLDPVQRYQSAAELRDELESYLRNAEFHREENTIGKYMEQVFSDRKRQREQLIQNAAAHTSQLLVSPDSSPAPDEEDEPPAIESDENARVIEARSLLAPPIASSPREDAAPSIAGRENTNTQVNLRVRRRPRTAHPFRSIADVDHTQVVRPIAVGTQRTRLVRGAVVGLFLAIALGLAGGLVVAWTHDKSAETVVADASVRTRAVAGQSSSEDASAMVVITATPPDAGSPDASQQLTVAPADAGATEELQATLDATVPDSIVHRRKSRAERRREAAVERRAKAAKRRAKAVERRAKKRALLAARRRARRADEQKEQEQKEQEQKEQERNEQVAKASKQPDEEKLRREEAVDDTTEQRAARRKQARDAYQRGIKQFISGNLGGAQSQFAEAIRLSPGYALPHRGLGLIYERRGKRSRARSEFKKYLRMSPRAQDADAIRARIERLGG